MKPREALDEGQRDMFQARLDQIIDMGHPKAVLARQIDWRHLAQRFGECYSEVSGHPALPTRLMAGLQILKYSENLSDEVLCDRWLENPYYQYFCGEEFFQHELPFDRSSMTRWRQRMGDEKLEALLQESLFVAVKLGAAKPADFTQVIVDTTVQEKNAAFPTDAKLAHRARERLVRLADKLDVTLRQSYARVGKLALIMQQRYAHAKQFNRAKAKLRTLRTYLGRTIRDITRKIAGNSFLQNQFAAELHKANRVLTQRPRDGGKHIYSLHAPEVECIGKGKSHKPYEFGVKATVATTLNRCKGGQFAIHAQALPGRPYDGHTLETVLPDIEALTGAGIRRVLADAGYKGHNAPLAHKFHVFTTGQKRGVTEQIKRQMKRRAAVEPVIGHIKNEHRMNRNYLAHSRGDAANAILAAAGYNFSLILKWIKALWLILCWALFSSVQAKAA
jgi:transposase, IS5 family